LSSRIGSGKQVASVIVDDGKDQDDEDDTFVVEDTHAIQNDLDVVSKHKIVVCKDERIFGFCFCKRFILV